MSEGGRYSVVRLERHWFVACAGKELGERPLARTIQGTPLVLFRDERGAPAALLDRCAHRNVPLSLGRCEGGGVRCAYHGWRFDGTGACREVPGLLDPAESANRRVPSFATREYDGFVWVCGSPGVEPEHAPFRFPFLDDRRYTIVRRSVRLRATLHAAIENALDVPHTAFLHGGLFRTPRGGREIEIVIRRGRDRVEAEYVGEPRPSGLVGRVIAPGGGEVRHVDRFILPSIAQVEYRLGDATHFVASAAFTPVDDFETVLHAAVALRLPPALALLRPLVTPIALRIVGQDARILGAQTDTVRRFGGERFAHTELDALGPYIGHLLRRAEEGKDGEGDGQVVRRRMRI